MNFLVTTKNKLIMCLFVLICGISVVIYCTMSSHKVSSKASIKSDYLLNTPNTLARHLNPCVILYYTRFYRFQWFENQIHSGDVSVTETPNKILTTPSPPNQ